jgi:hypothetical protein
LLSDIPQPQSTFPGVLMLDKCANPICPNPFRRLNQGQLFRVEQRSYAAVTTSPLAAARRIRPRRRVEHYWLCDQCSSTLTLIFEKECGMLTVPLSVTKRNPAAERGPADETQRPLSNIGQHSQ